MNEPNEKEITSGLIERDLKLSVLSGPLTFVVPILSYLFLYPIILSRSNLEVLGIWSLYVTTVSFLTVVDLGFSQHFMREAGGDRDSNILKSLKAEWISARRFYIILGLVGLISVILLRSFLFNSVSSIYSSTGLLSSALILVVGTTALLISSLDAAILSARADNYFVKLIRSVSPVFTYSFAIIGALIEMPIEGFAVGILFSNLFLNLIYRNRIRKKHKDWHSTHLKLPLNQTIYHFRQLIKKGWKLYSVSVGMIIRQPILRYIIALSLGLPAAGVFDIAMRVTSTSRDVVASGFSSLYPSLAYFFRNNNREKVIGIIKKSLMFLLPIGVIIAAILIFNSQFIFNLWLKAIPRETISATKILAVWQLMTIINIPFWYLLQAAHQEKIAALTIWTHTILILLLIPLTFIGINFKLDEFLIYWTITAVLTQWLIYFSVQRKLFLLWDVLRDAKIIRIFILSGSYLILNIIFRNFVGSSYSSELISLLITSVFIVFLLPLYLPIFRKSTNI